ncbi:ABC transporter permease [Arthrobacter sp. NicSoilB8]|uniref:ABC transporter permease n=1 Tax=Arthrobacter sp. NicSoilB8 TaxID=2830998 RepID=UPI001CC63BDA|nr:ABC transporter permease [Arthrobacter sp. NicSoilB8]BCW73420.1 ABC transporter substrate-binding protein [Arthrobacter sp. NicSoilB8]
MYLAIRDIRFAKGRFALMGAVVALITLLLVMLSGLTAGLGNQSTSALAALPADQLVFGAPAGSPPKASFTESEVTRAQQAEWMARDGVARADALGISQSRFQALGPGGVPARTASVAVFGTEPGTGLAPAPLAEGTVAVGAGLAAELDLSIGSRASVGGTDLIVTAIVPEQWYSHTGVVWTTLNDWQKLAHIPDGGAATVLAVKFDGGKFDGGTADAGGSDSEKISAAPGADTVAANAAAATVSTTVEGSFQALGSYKSENGSLLLMQAFLYGISALVIVAFLTVWTVQRTRDIAVLKALGGSARYILRDAMAQAALVLLAGAAAGGLAGLAGGVLASRAAPFLLTPATTLLPIAGIVILGLAGAALAVRSVARVDPLIALGGN